MSVHQQKSFILLIQLKIKQMSTDLYLGKSTAHGRFTYLFTYLMEWNVSKKDVSLYHLNYNRCIMNVVS